MMQTFVDKRSVIKAIQFDGTPESIKVIRKVFDDRYTIKYYSGVITFEPESGSRIGSTSFSLSVGDWVAENIHEDVFRVGNSEFYRNFIIHETREIEYESVLPKVI